MEPSGPQAWPGARAPGLRQPYVRTLLMAGAACLAAGSAQALPNGHWTHPAWPPGSPAPQFSSREAACESAFQAYRFTTGEPNTYDGCIQLDADDASGRWHSVTPYVTTPYWYGQQVWLVCDPGYTPVVGRCEGDDHPDTDSDCNSCGNSTPTTDHPINLLTGRKTFRAEDFATADASLKLERIFASKIFAGTGPFALGAVRGLENWAFGFQYEVQVSSAFNGSNPVVVLATPEGTAPTFRRQSDGSMAPNITTARPLPQTDYKLEFLDAWPSNITWIRNAAMRWRMTDPDDNVWLLQSFPGRDGLYNVAVPIRMTAKSGLILDFAYDAKGVLTQVSDNRGKAMTFTWLKENGYPRRVTQIDLPDATKLKYSYDETDGVEFNARLTKVERVNAANVVLDATSYDYGDTNYPAYVTGVRDRDNVLRWSVTYDAQGRATSSSGPGGVLEAEVAYGAAGTTFTRTLINALGKQTTYTFTKSGAAIADPKVTEVAGLASTNTPASSTATTYGSDKFIGSQTDDEGRTTTYVRDAKGRAVSVTEADGLPEERTTAITYASNIDAASQIVQPGLTTDFTFQDVGDPPAPGQAPDSTATHAYWRVRILANTHTRIDWPWVDIAEVEFRATAGAADQAVGGTPIESGNGCAGSANAFDDNASTYWCAPGTQPHDSWLGYHFAAPVAVNQLQLRMIDDFQPRDFVIESSDDGVSWTVEWYVLDELWGTDVKLFNRLASPPKTGAYSQWRIRIWQTNWATQAHAGGEYASISEVEFRGSVGGADQASGGTAISNGAFHPTLTANYAFDNDGNSRWAAVQPPRHATLGYSFATPVSVAEVSIKAPIPASNVAESPKDFAIQYFADGRWHMAKDVDAQTGWTSGQVRTYTVP